MTAPIITVVSFTRSKISSVVGDDISTVLFRADQILTDWEARAGGAGVGQGLLVGKAASSLVCGTSILCSTSLKCQSANSFPANSDLYFDVDHGELTNGDGIYRINTYGKNTGGEWTAYGS